MDMEIRLLKSLKKLSEANNYVTWKMISDDTGLSSNSISLILYKLSNCGAIIEGQYTYADPHSLTNQTISYQTYTVSDIGDNMISKYDSENKRSNTVYRLAFATFIIALLTLIVTALSLFIGYF